MRPSLRRAGYCIGMWGNMVQEGEITSLNKALVDYFRCPEVFADFALRGELCPGEGYFRFGPDVICYGQSSLGYYGETSEKTTCDANATLAAACKMAGRGNRQAGCAKRITVFARTLKSPFASNCSDCG